MTKTLRIEILHHGKVIKTCCFDLTGTTRSAMWNSFLNYWDRHFGWNSEYTWHSTN